MVLSMVMISIPRDPCQASSHHFTGGENVAQRRAVTHLTSHSILMAEPKEETGVSESHLDSLFIMSPYTLDYHLAVHHESAVGEPIW